MTSCQIQNTFLPAVQHKTRDLIVILENTTTASTTTTTTTTHQCDKSKLQTEITKTALSTLLFLKVQLPFYPLIQNYHADLHHYSTS